MIRDDRAASRPSDRVLSRRAGMGDRDAFSELFRRHSAATFRYALHMLDGKEHEAQEAAQEAWIKAWRHLSSFHGDAAPRTWLFQIVAREVLNSRRRRRPTPVDDELLSWRLVDPYTPEDRIRELELWQALALALKELPWRQRASWLLREFEGLSYVEIAAVLGTSPPVVRGQLHRARRALAVRLEQWR